MTASPTAPAMSMPASSSDALERFAKTMGNTSIVGLQWGDEGKGKIIDLLSGHFDYAVRWNGGSNAGHRVRVGTTDYRFHLIPIGILRPNVTCVICNGVVIDPISTLGEIDGLTTQGVAIDENLKLSSKANVVLPYHKLQDQLSESKATSGNKIGTTGRGIGPCYADKANRSTAVRLGDLLDDKTLSEKLSRIVPEKNAVLKALYGADPIDWKPIFEQYRSCGEQLRPYITDTVRLLHAAVKDKKRMMFEGANAVLLDVDHGTVPFVTSSNCGTGLSVGTGLPAKVVNTTLGIVKAYSTRVGTGPFPTEQSNDIGNKIRERGHEYGTTTGRPRRCGWLDTVAIRYSVAVSGASAVALMLLDVLSTFDELKICTAYDVPGSGRTDWFPADGGELDRAVPVCETLAGWHEPLDHVTHFDALPENAKRYVERIEALIGVPIRIVSIGPARHQTLVR